MRTQLYIILQVCLVVACVADFSGFAYQGQTAQEKMDQLWEQITSDTTSNDWYNALTFGGIFLEDMSVSFDTYSDVLPDGRLKLIHSVGTVVQAEFVAEEGSPYTGMFQGVSNVLVRISTAKQPDGTKAPSENFVPGMGIKLLRDNVPSANLVAMFGVDGQDSFNVFANNWSNHIPSPVSVALKLLGKKFAEATPYIGTIGLKTWGQYDQNGNSVSDSDIDIPFQLIFSPSSDVNTLFPDTYQDELPNQLQSIPSGTTLFDVYAVDQPDADAVLIGRLTTKSEFVTSYFGDTSLFFQHNYFEDDIALHPNWANAVSNDQTILASLMKHFH